MRRLRVALLSVLLTGCFIFSDDQVLSGPWTGEFVVGGETFAVTTELVGSGGRLEGPVSAPGVTGRLNVLVEDERVTLSGSYRAQGCDGRMTGAGELVAEDDVAVMRGTVSVVDSCSGELGGRFRLAKVEEASSDR